MPLESEVYLTCLESKKGRNYPHPNITLKLNMQTKKACICYKAPFINFKMEQKIDELQWKITNTSHFNVSY